MKQRLTDIINSTSNADLKAFCENALASNDDGIIEATATYVDKRLSAAEKGLPAMRKELVADANAGKPVLCFRAQVAPAAKNTEAMHAGPLDGAALSCGFAFELRHDDSLVLSCPVTNLVSLQTLTAKIGPISTWMQREIKAQPLQARRDMLLLEALDRAAQKGGKQ